MNTPRRPLVPSPSVAVPGLVQSATGGSGIAQRAIELRERAVEQQKQDGNLPAPSREEYEKLVRVPGPIGQIAGAIANVMANIGTIEKGGYNAFHKYRYARMEDLLVALTPLIGQNGLAVIQSEVGRSIVEGNRLAVDYEFTVLHKSGEIWPAIRQAGMSTARDSKGNWDDKAVAKAHTNARKYFLLSLFQVPAGDFDDPDVDRQDANQRQEQRPVPGPKQTQPQQADERKMVAQAEIVGPHKIALGPGAGADQWAGAYIKAIDTAKSGEEIKQWDDANDQALQQISDRYPKVYEMVEAAVNRKLDQLAGKSEMPKGDNQAAMNWIAEQLQAFKTYEAAEAWWNKEVAPLEKTFDLVDWEMLMEEWARTTNRLAPPQDGA